MIIITGDTHIPHDISKLNIKNFPQQNDLTKDDFVIITGDFGGIWDLAPSDEEKYWLKCLDDKPFTTLFVDGNHENFPRLAEFPVSDFHGGKARKISKSVWHLMRGEIYTLDNKKFFAFGGASSHDRQYRKEGVSWWSEELPSTTEIEYARANLEKHYNRVDVILSHCSPTHIQNLLVFLAGGSSYGNGDILTQYFETVYDTVQYQHWFFGHYHLDKNIDERHHCLYQEKYVLKP